MCFFLLLNTDYNCYYYYCVGEKVSKISNQMKIDISVSNGCIRVNPNVEVHVFFNTHCWHCTVLIFNAINKNKIKFFISIDGHTRSVHCLFVKHSYTFNNNEQNTPPQVQSKQTASWTRKSLIRMKQQEEKNNRWKRPNLLWMEQWATSKNCLK